MKSSIKIVLLGLLIISANCTSKETSEKVNNEEMESSSEHTIMMYNVENLFDTVDDPHTRDNDFLPNSDKEWTNKRFKHKLNQLSDVILGIDSEPPSIIGMVEVENAYVLEQLTDNAYIKRFNYGYVHHESPDERGIDVALIYDKDKFEVDEHKQIPVYLDKNDKTRDILYVKGYFKGENSPFYFLVNHWPSRREGAKESEHKRIAAAETLRYQVDKILENDSHANIIIMGDFNDYPTSSSIVDYLLAKKDKDIKTNEIFNLSYKLHERGKGSYNYRGDWVMMDQIMVSGNVLNKNNTSYYVKSDGLKVFFEDWILYEDKKYRDMKPNKTYGGDNYYGGYSDHLPVYVKLKKSY